MSSTLRSVLPFSLFSALFFTVMAIAPIRSSFAETAASQLHSHPMIDSSGPSSVYSSGLGWDPFGLG